ncbi:MAG: hypothetical protein PHW77_06295 [Eubacteriales bacterium]|nr:hypothetical protein [Eubacteriales bacterium]
MKIGIESNIIRSFLKNVYFINGTAYAGKSTMVHMLAEKYGLIECGENWHDRYCENVITPELQPGLGYFQTKKSWQEFVNRTPNEYERWADETSMECAEIEIAALIELSHKGKIIADTNIPIHMLKEISDYNHVAIMLSPQSMSVDKFFERSDPEKQFLLNIIGQAENPEKTMANFKACIARLNDKRRYDELANSGFFTLVRENAQKDTRKETFEILSKHFNLQSK